jgi:hypothetical protein
MKCPDLTTVQVSARCKFGVAVKAPLTHIKALPVFRYYRSIGAVR